MSLFFLWLRRRFFSNFDKLVEVKMAYLEKTTKPLNSYLTKINTDIPNIYPACKESPHDSNHFFVYPAKLTHLTQLSLWFDHFETARFLGLPLDHFVDNQPEPYHLNGD